MKQIIGFIFSVVCFTALISCRSVEVVAEPQLDMLERLHLCAEAGNPAADFLLGEFYTFHGAITRKNTAKKHYRCAAEKGHALAQYRLGKLLLKEGYSEERHREAVENFERALGQGYYPAGKALADHYMTAYSTDKIGTTPPNPEAALEVSRRYEILCRSAAEMGDSQAMRELGLLYQDRSPTPENINEAIDWFCRAARDAHQLTWSVPLTPSTFEAMLARAETGDASAQYLVAKSLQGNPSEAQAWLRRAAEGGHSNAQFSLAMLLTGEAESTEWHRKAAAQNHPASIAILIINLYEGNTARGQSGKAKRLSAQRIKNLRAEAKADAAAQGELAAHYAYGYDVPRDLNQALELALKAAQGGFVKVPQSFFTQPLSERTITAKGVYGKNSSNIFFFSDF